jgi:hypothetical protein
LNPTRSAWLKQCQSSPPSKLDNRHSLASRNKIPIIVDRVELFERRYG